MKLSGSRLQFGIQHGALKHISEVSGGLDCDCRCASCDDRLVAKKGSINQHHFAHACGSECATALETALHFAAKQILESRREIYLPSFFSNIHGQSSKFPVINEQLVGLENVKLERKIGQIIPDVTTLANGQPLNIEIRVTHSVDSFKLERIRELGLSTIEIDLSKVLRNLTFECLEILVIGRGEHKKWLYNAGEESEKREIFLEGGVLPASTNNFVGIAYERSVGEKSRDRGEAYPDLFGD